MGIYDRDYYREEESPSFSIPRPSSMVGLLIVINVVAYLANALLTPESNTITRDWLSAHGYTLSKPWLWWQFVTYGFAHDPRNLGHILFNMLVLWFLGREVEGFYGRKEFLRLYLVMLALGSVIWGIINWGDQTTLLGASGAVTGVVILFALNFPRRTLLLFFVLPVPAWLVGMMVVVFDLMGAIQRGGENVAYLVHLTGAAFAFLYYRFGWNLGRLTPEGFRLPSFRRRPKLRIHHSDEQNELSDEVDRILEKIHREGEESLTRKERRTLENASRRYQRRRRE